MSIQSESVTIITAGGLGDMLIVLAKLKNEHLRNQCNFKIIRYDLFAQYDDLISDLVGSSGFAEFVEPSKVFADICALNAAIKTAAFQYVDTKWNRTSQETYPFDYVALDPFLNFNVESPVIQRERQNIGIQLFCGVEGHNFRGFSLDWLRNMRSRFPSDKFALWLFGDGATLYGSANIDKACSSLGIVSLVDRLSFRAWMGYICEMDMVVSLEGFSALFALSQKVPTLLYNQYSCGISDSLHPEWLKYGNVININSNILRRKFNQIFNKHKLYSPAISEKHIGAHV